MRAGGVAGERRPAGADGPPVRRTGRPGLARATLALTLAALASGGCATAGGGPPAAPAGALAALDRPPLDGVHWGILVLDRETGDTLLARGAERRFVPASNQKLLATAAALLALGPDHRFEAALLVPAGAPDAAGVVAGDIVLPAHGDPTLSERFWPDDEAPLRALADSLHAAGVREVHGALVVDVSAWDSTTVEGTWMVDDLPFAWAATGGAFAIGEGIVTAVVRGAEPGRPAQVTWRPAGHPDFVRSEVITAAADDTTARITRGWLPESRRIHLTGAVRRGEADTLRLAVRDPVAEASRALLGALTARGIHVRDGLRVAWDTGQVVAAGCRTGALASCPAYRPIATLRSPPLMEIAEAILEPSQNWMAEQLAHHLGEVLEGDGSWRGARRALGRVLVDSLGVDSLDLHVVDGSGLSAYNLVTPRALARLLEGVARRPWGAAFREALPTPGEEDSTLESRLAGLEGRFHAKTGSITHVNALSGYLTTDSGRELVVVLMSNGTALPASEVRAALDAVVRELAGGGG